MNINRSNYEIFFLDYHEGNLPLGQEKILFAFLEENPDLKEEFEAYENLKLEPELKNYSGKNELKRMDAATVEELFIGYYENDLNSSQHKRLQELLKKESLYREFLLHEKLKLEAFVSYPFKNDLKRTPFSFKIYRQVAGWAAAAAVLIFLFLFDFDKNETGKTITARVKETDYKFKSTEKAQFAHSEKTVSTNKKTDFNSQKNKEKKNVSFSQKSIEALPAIKASQISPEEKTLAIILNDEEKKISVPSTGNTNEVFLTPKQLLTQKIKNSSESTVAEQKVNGWDIASLAVKTLGKLTGKKITLERNNQDGSFALVAGKLEITQTKSK